jgi:hypothetical protein
MRIRKTKRAASAIPSTLAVLILFLSCGCIGHGALQDVSKTSRVAASHIIGTKYELLVDCRLCRSPWDPYDILNPPGGLDPVGSWKLTGHLEARTILQVLSVQDYEAYPFPFQYAGESIVAKVMSGPKTGAEIAFGDAPPNKDKFEIAGGYIHRIDQ